MLIPNNYQISFDVDLEKFTFWAKEILTFKLNFPTKIIELDTVDLEIVGCQLLLDKKNIVVSFKTNQSEQKLFVHLSRNLGLGEYKLFIEFNGILNDKLAGFYRSRYLANGKEKYLATTQFEAADARRAFPCIDHPSYKATFDVLFIIDKHLTAISNTLPIKSIDLDYHANLKSTWQVKDWLWHGAKKGKKMAVFEKTPAMSTYLLYLGVGEFEFLEGKYKDIRLRVVTTSGKSKYGKFALECAKKALKYFEVYFDYTYPLKKLDLIAIPDFASGAMENWGAITFRENALLLYPGLSSKATKQRIAEVVAHELVHQWFGNLITMKWWDDLWLNESFATYMAHKAMNHYWPEWKVWDQYVTDTVFEAMGLDSLKSSHPIKVKVKHISEIDELFDEIAYEKGGSILRMLDQYVGENAFRNALREYIKSNAYKNTEASDLWKSVEKKSEKPVIKLMQKYITQVGFPLLEIKMQDNKLLLNQSRFLYHQDQKNKSQTWIIPLQLLHGRTSVVYNFSVPTQKIELPKKFDFINVNHRYRNFMITNYQKELLELLGKNIRQLSDEDKLGMIHDLFALILAGKKDLVELYRCIDTFFIKERSNIVLHYLISKLIGIHLLIKDKNSRKLATWFATESLEKIVGYSPQQEENILETYLRVACLSSLTLFGDKKVAKFLEEQFMLFLKDEKLLHPDLRTVTYAAAVWFDEVNYQVVKNLYKTSSVQEEKAKLLSALGYTKKENLIQETLEYTLSKDVPFSFLPYAISSIARNPFAKEIALNWLVEYWPELVNRSGGLANMLVRRVLQSVIPICGIGREKEVENFLKKNKIKGLEKTVDQIFEELIINSRFVKKYGS